MPILVLRRKELYSSCKPYAEGIQQHFKKLQECHKGRHYISKEEDALEDKLDVAMHSMMKLIVDALNDVPSCL